MKNHIIENYFQDDQRNKVIVECGAFRGGESVCVDLENQFGWKYYGIEPSPTNFSYLEKCHPNGINSNIAISNNDGIALFTETVDCGWSSLTHPQLAKRAIASHDVKILEYNVVTSTWKSFVSSKQLSHVDVLIVDTEGHEVEVFQGMENCDILPDVICTEFGMSDKQDDQKGQENFSGFIKLSKIMSSLGYEFDYVNFNNAFFSKKSFWDGKRRPETWFSENLTFEFWGTTWYDKEKCKNILMSIS